MTPEERARDIVVRFSGQTFSWSKDAQDWLVKEIREATQETARRAAEIAEKDNYFADDAAKQIRKEFGVEGREG